MARLNPDTGSAEEQQQYLVLMLDGILQGDRNAFAWFYKLTSPHVFGLLSRLLPHQSWAEEILHESFLAIWRHEECYGPDDGTPQAWVCGIARERACRLLRMNRREVRQIVAEDRHYCGKRVA